MTTTETRFAVPYGAGAWQQNVPNPVGLQADPVLYRVHGARLRRVVAGFDAENWIDVYASTIEVNLKGRDLAGEYVVVIR